MRMIAGTAWGVEAAREYIEERVQMVPWSGCWLWEKALGRHGYGQATVPRALATGPRSRQAHRLAYEAFVGAIPEHDSYHGVCVLHRCDVPACCCPSHLFLGTQRDNMADMTAKDRSLRGRHHNMAKLTEGDVRDVLRRCAAGETQQSIADSLGVRHQTISKIKRRQNWSHITADGTMRVEREAENA